MKTIQKTPEEIKESVKQKYAMISTQSRADNADSCCGSDACSSPVETVEYSVFADDYSELEGYTADADLGLGCGLPTEYAHIEEGDTVVDLGSGAGNDCFVARQMVGEQGQVIGIDMTDAMIEKAKSNTAKLGYSNVKFLAGEIENMPIKNETADVVISNCVMNLVPDKQQAFNETYRIMKKGGHFSISDVVLIGALPEELKNDAEMYAGCVSGAVDKDEYMEVIRKAGFENLKIQKEKRIHLPAEILEKHMSSDEVIDIQKSDAGIFSITVYAEKP